MADALARFAREYQAYNQLSADRRRRQVKLLEAFAATLDGRALTDATRDDLQAFAGTLTESYHVNTVRTKLNMIRPFFSWAYAVGLISADQYLGLKSVKDPRGATGKSLPKPYSRDELTAFWSTLNERHPLLPARGKGSQAIRRWQRGTGPWRNVWKHAMRLQIEAIVALALDCGLRRGEIHRLSLADLHYDNEYIVVQSAPKGDGVPRVREVPYTDEAREIVKRWLEFRVLVRPEHDSPWLSLYGYAYRNPMHFQRLEELLRTRVGDGWELHRFRHTCATNWLRAGMPLEKVSKLIGHTSMEQTLCYAEILKGDVTREVVTHQDSFAKLNMRPALAA